MFKTISKVAALAVVASSLGFAAVAPAHAESPPVTPPAHGRRCSFSSIADPTLEGDAQTGQINGGPIVAEAPGAAISMTCTIQVGAANWAHNGTDSCSVSSTPTLQATATAGNCTYDSPDGQPVYMCSQVTINGVTWYWNDDSYTGSWWTTSSAAACAGAITPELMPGPTCRTTLDLHALLNNGPLDEEAPGDYSDGDFVSLGGGAVLIGPDGDLYVSGIWFFDCRPFDNFPTDPDRVIFPDQYICPLGPDGTYGSIIIVQGDLYFDLDFDGDADPDELFWNCPPYS